MAPRTDWNPLLRGEFEKEYWEDLQDFVRDERTLHQVFPPQEEVFAALHLTSYASVRVLILGQDPYHGPRQAHGLCFSVRPWVAKPPSLVNIFSELHDDIGAPVPEHGSLQALGSSRGAVAQRHVDGAGPSGCQPSRYGLGAFHR